MSLDVVLQQKLPTRGLPIRLDIELACANGELLALVGPSGSGKSTVLRTIAGLMRPEAGHITCNGQHWFLGSPSALEKGKIWLEPQQRRVGLVFQDYALLPHLSALQNVALPLGRLDGRTALARASELLTMVNLDGLENRRPDQLSGGQRQRVALARALARDPEVLLLDEPFSAVDQMTRERLKRELAALRDKVKIPIILVTHDLDEAMALADRLSVMYRGGIAQTGKPEDVRLRPSTQTTARLVGQSNIFGGKLLAPAQGGQPGRLSFGPHILEVARTNAFKAGETVAWLVSSEYIVLHRRGRPSQGERENPISGTIAAINALGEQTAVTVRLDSLDKHSLNFRLPTHSARRNELAVGQMVTASLLADGLHLMPPDHSETVG